MKKIYLTVVIVTIISSLFFNKFNHAFAQADVQTTISDYLKDIQEGQTQISNDKEAESIQEEILKSEEAQAQVDSQEVKPQEEVSPQEAKESIENLEPTATSETVDVEIQPDQKEEIINQQTDKNQEENILQPAENSSEKDTEKLDQKEEKPE